MRRILAGILAMISGVRPSGSGSSAGSPSGSWPSGSSLAARWPWVRWAFSSDVAACTACIVRSSSARSIPAPSAAGGAGAAAAAARPAPAGRAAGRAAAPSAAKTPLVEAVVALQVLLDDLQEPAGLRALDDAVVVGRGHRHDLLGADRGADRAEADGVGDRARGDDRALAGHEPRDGGDRADAARVGQRDVGPDEVVGAQRVRAGLVDELVEGGLELARRSGGPRRG